MQAKAPLINTMELDENKLTTQLWEQMRWTEAAYPVKAKHDTFIYFASLWGVSGASGGGHLYHQNEKLLEQVLQRGMQLGQVPYIICGDFNIPTDKSEFLKQAFATGWWVSAGEVIFGQDQKPTFGKKHGGVHTTESASNVEKGLGFTCIDGFLVNLPALQMLSGMEYLYSIPGAAQDHVPLKLILDVQKVTRNGMVWNRPLTIPVEMVPFDVAQDLGNQWEVMTQAGNIVDSLTCSRWDLLFAQEDVGPLTSSGT